MSVLQLYCLPYSGVSAMVYRRWQHKLPAWLSVKPIELPGRGARLSEPLQTDMSTLVAQLAREIQQNLNQPYALFGHSLGALLAFELAHVLDEMGCAAPVILFASGSAAPTHREQRAGELAGSKTDTELVDELRDLQSTAESVLATQELMSLTLPMLRADFLLCSTYQYRYRPRLPCSLHVLGGKADKVSGEQLLAWQEQASKTFSLTMFEGGHFFIHQQEVAILHLIIKSLKTLVNLRTREHQGELQ